MSPTFWKSDTPSRVDIAAERERAEAQQWRACCRLVDARDNRTCRACGRVANPEAVGLLKRAHRHHIRFRSAGGEDVSSNICLLCSNCHNDVHVKRRLDIEGDADIALTFLRRDEAETWFVWRQEISIGHFEKD